MECNITKGSCCRRTGKTPRTGRGQRERYRILIIILGREVPAKAWQMRSAPVWHKRYRARPRKTWHRLRSTGVTVALLWEPAGYHNQANHFWPLWSISPTKARFTTHLVPDFLHFSNADQRVRLRERIESWLNKSTSPCLDIFYLKIGLGKATLVSYRSSIWQKLLWCLAFV